MSIVRAPKPYRIFKRIDERNSFIKIEKYLSFQKNRIYTIRPSFFAR